MPKINAQRTPEDFETRKQWLRNHHHMWKVANGIEVAEEDLGADLNYLDDTQPAI